MYYPVYAFMPTKTHNYSALLPDFGHVLAMSDDWDTLHDKIQESAERYLQGKRIEINQPSDIEELSKTNGYCGGFWMSVDLNVAKLEAAS